MTKTNARAGSAAIVFRDVVKVYNSGVRALDNVSFEIPGGETVALLGPNGAGKPNIGFWHFFAWMPRCPAPAGTLRAGR